MSAKWEPGSDPLGDYPDDLIEVTRYPEGVALILPRSADRLDGERRAMIRELQRIGSMLAHLSEHADGLALDCREAGISWSLIGFCLGLSGEAVRRRYGSPFGDGGPA
jgi:hypothetical protein